MHYLDELSNIDPLPDEGEEIPFAHWQKFQGMQIGIVSLRDYWDMLGEFEMEEKLLNPRRFACALVIPDTSWAVPDEMAAKFCGPECKVLSGIVSVDEFTLGRIFLVTGWPQYLEPDIREQILDGAFGSNGLAYRVENYRSMHVRSKQQARKPSAIHLRIQIDHVGIARFLQTIKDKHKMIKTSTVIH